MTHFPVGPSTHAHSRSVCTLALFCVRSSHVTHPPTPPYTQTHTPRTHARTHAHAHTHTHSLDLFVKPEFNVIEVENGEQRSSIKLCLLTVQM